jgi:hypothetical protein
MTGLDLSWLETEEAFEELRKVMDPKAHLVDCGLPPIDREIPGVSRFEFWPMWKLYGLPALYHILWGFYYGGLRLPSVTNPGLPLGGWVGESKLDIFESMEGSARAIVPHYVGVKESDILEGWEAVERKVSAGGLTYPYLMKPAVGCRGAGVQLIGDGEKLRRYCESFPLGGDIVAQRLVPYMGEAGVFYVREPGEREGKIFGITLKYFLEVEGDGEHTLEALIEDHWRASSIASIYKVRHGRRLQECLGKGERYRINFTGSHSRGTIFREGTHYATERLRQAMDVIADGIPEFYFGRFDFRFRDFGEFLEGKNMALLELNGAGGEATNVWDSGKSLSEVYSILKEQYRLMYKIGAMNRKRGYREAGYGALWSAWRRESRLMTGYPYTD